MALDCANADQICSEHGSFENVGTMESWSGEGGGFLRSGSACAGLHTANSST